MGTDRPDDPRHITRSNDAPHDHPGVLGAILRFSIARRGFVVLACAGIAALGLFGFQHLPIDAVPDITTVQVQINTVVEGLSPVDVEKRVTFPIEMAMAGIPGIEQTRSLSRYGLSQITVVFRDGTDIYFARQLVNERLQEAVASLPQGIEQPALGPIATGLGEIFQWTVETDSGAVRPNGLPYTATDLREIQDWVVRPQLRTVPGVTEVNTIGGYRRQYHVTPYPERLIAYGISFEDVTAALTRNNGSAGGGHIAHKGEQYLVSTSGQLGSAEDIGEVVAATRNGVPIRMRDIAAIGEGRELRTGAATENGQEVVLGTAFMLIGENSRTVSKRVAARLAEVNRSLPPGVRAKPVYDRTKLVEATLRTVETNLLEGALLVIAVLFLLLGNARAALIVALVIPLSMLFAILGMVQGRISANLLSLGAIDFGIIVDGAVVMVENIMRRFASRQHALGRPLDHGERLAEAYAASHEVARPTLFGVAVIMIVYLPILALTGIEGKMFRPMAQVVLLALLGALVFTFTLVPALVAIVLRGRVAEAESPLLRLARRAYVPSLAWAMRHRSVVVVGAASLLVGSLLVATQLGSEFVPQLDEGDLAVQALRIPGTSIDQAVLMQQRVEKAIASFPEVSFAFSRIGTAEIANDPMPPHVADGIVILKPRREWPHPRRDKADLIAAMEEKLALLPGNAYEYSQPIQLRVNELIAGVRGDLSVKVFGDDLETMTGTAQRIAAVLRDVRGASDVKVEQVSGLPTLLVDIDRAAVARFGLSTSDVQAVVRTALAGTAVGEVFEGDRRFEIVVRLPETVRRDIHALGLLPVPVRGVAPSRMLAALPAGHEGDRTEFVPLAAVARIELREGPNQVSRENGKRRVVVQANVRGRDIGSFVAEAQRRVAAGVKVPPGYWLGWGGQFENMLAARARLALVVPAALLLILVLLFMAFGSVRDALLVFSGVPFALSGGILALAARGMPLSITAGVGFIALSGVAVLNGVVMLSFIRKLRAEGASHAQAVTEGSAARLRAVLMTALVASLGFVPMALATGTGAEVQRPLATVVMGGIVSSTLLTLLVLPVLHMRRGSGE